MNKSIAAIILVLLCFSICQGNAILDSTVYDCNCVYNPDSNTCDCNCVCEEPELLYVSYYFDDFNEAFDLNWHCDDFDFTHMSFAKVPGALTITTQKGTYGNEDCKNLFYFNFPASQALDFQVTVCISNYEPNGLGNQAGLILFHDKDNFFKYVYEYGQESYPNDVGQLLLTTIVETAGLPEYSYFETEQYSQKMWLRIVKRGDLCRLYNSTDGKTFNLPKTLLQDGITDSNSIPCPSFPITKIGVFANNGNANGAPEVDASFEFLEFRVLPSEPNLPEEPNIPDDMNVCDCNCVYNSDSNTCDCNCVCPEPEPLPVAFLFDDFNEALDLSWTILKEDESHWSLTKRTGTLTITTQSGSFEYSNTDYHNVFLLKFPVSQLMDFQITTCISNFNLRQQWNQAGLLLWYDEENYLKYVYEYGNDTPKGAGVLFTVGTQINGGSEFNWYLADQTPQTTWMRIIKHGEVYEFYSSTDGETFIPLKIYRGSRNSTYPCLPTPLINIGIFTSNYITSTAPEVDASFEYFEFKTLPEEKNTE